ncbi:MAG TPA: A/G-specific adenine glycosylase [Terriglobales bacterium]|nr:A/G-specific adenine glycosylase [Terriglobales bacterium]
MRASGTNAVETRLAASPGPRAGNSLAAFRRALLRWYDQHRRDLPWRETRDPYRIWLSEIMLQQTRVAAVLDHYRIFLKRFPNVQELAAASEDAVLAAWSGLGYYRRARMLHQCAEDVVEKHGGRFPRNSEALLALPGIGRYTAAAIASIAFGKPVAVVDGNVERVLQRFIGIDLAGPQPWRRAQALLDHSRPGDFNQAMMELGATVCVPREPRCLACPVRKWCATRGEVPRPVSIELMPASRQNKKQIWCALDWRDGSGSDSARGNGKVRLVQRPRKSSLMPGMWELPQSSEPPRPLPASAPWRTFRHSITVTDYTVHVLRNTMLRNMPSPAATPAAEGKWIAIDHIPQMPITGLTRKILKAGGII